MNKRIRELAKQAGVDFIECTNPEHGGREFCEAWIEQQQKFAELIIQECGNALSPMLRDMISRGQAYELIKKHFGFEK